MGATSDTGRSGHIISACPCGLPNPRARSLSITQNASHKNRQLTYETTGIHLAQTGRVEYERPPTIGRRPSKNQENSGSALGVLRSATSFMQTRFLALDDARVTGQEAVLLKSRAVGVTVDRVQRAGHT